MIDPLVMLIAVVVACVGNKLPWQRIFGLSKDPNAESAKFPAIVVGFASFFVCQCGALVFVLATRPEFARRVMPWQFALGAFILVGALLLNSRLRARLRKGDKPKDTENNT